MRTADCAGYVRQKSLLTGLMVVFLVLCWGWQISEAITPIADSDRVFMLGDRWVWGGTVNQLDGFR